MNPSELEQEFISHYNQWAQYDKKEALADCLKSLKDNMTITKLTLTNLTLTADQCEDLMVGLEHNRSLTDLKISSCRLYLDEINIERFAKSFFSNDSLIHLEFSGNDLGQFLYQFKPNNSLMTGKILQNLLSIKNSIEHLNLNSSEIVWGDAIALKSLITSGLSCSLSSLSLSFSTINNLSAIIEIFMSQNSLSALDLTNVAIDEKSATVLGNSLKENKTLTKLNITNTGSGPTRINPILNGLEHNDTLKVLDISSNYCSPIKLNSLEMMISELLIKNNVLEELYLNKLGLNDTACIWNALAQNTTLKTLSFKKNTISQNDAVVLLNALIENRTLVNVSLGELEINKAEMVDFLERLKIHPSLKTIRFENLDLINECRNEIIALLEQNPLIIDLGLDDWLKTEICSDKNKIKEQLELNRLYANESRFKRTRAAVKDSFFKVPSETLDSAPPSKKAKTIDFS